MTDSASPGERGDLVRAGTSSLQKVNSGLLRRAMDDVERLTSDVRILVSEPDEWFGRCIAGLTRELVRSSVKIALIIPETIREHDLLETAGRQKFDFAVLFLNNICYSSGNRDRVGEDSVALVKRMVTFPGRPLIGVYGWPDDPEYPSQVLDAGATAVFRAPFALEAMRLAIRRCLSNWHIRHGGLPSPRI